MVHSETASGKTTELQAVLNRLWERNHPYADKMKDAGVKPSDIRSPKDIEKLPFTTKQDLQA
ncbi:MAG TPA: phenylacetate--CoA ligase, partial [Synergistaceae bacterium]|nr:phenylacetate--CoA ligase [Synergistaceae bacterium]